MKVFLSAYACMPNRGSEQGVGWNWALGLSGKVQLTVLTRSSKRRSIEQGLEKLSLDHSLRSATFVYYDLPTVFLKLKKCGWLPTFVYYLLWQKAVARKYSELADQHDVVHHLTFCSILCPGFWRLNKANFIVGPVGGPIVPYQYLSMFGPATAITQRVRAVLIRNFFRISPIYEGYRRAKAVVPANNDTKNLLERGGIQCTEVLLDTASPNLPSDFMTGSRTDEEVIKFVTAGRLERRKGLELQLKAFSMARKKLESGRRVNLEIIGDGPDESRLKEMAVSLGVSNYVSFRGFIDREEVLKSFGSADVFIFTSIRDTSASVNLEAMACGLPIVCLSHQGVAEITSQDTALRIPPSSIDKTVEGIADAMVEIAENNSMRQQMGRRARERATKDFSWNVKFDRMMMYYQFDDAK